MLPFLYGTPALDRQEADDDADRQRPCAEGLAAFVSAAVKRYGPGGEFWAEHAPASRHQLRARGPRPVPIRTWQVWNEANFFYFAYPVSTGRYARLLKLT